MTTYTIDTHEAVRQFIAANILDKQAESNCGGNQPDRFQSDGRLDMSTFAQIVK